MSRFFPLMLLVGSNLFMTYAWYGHLRDMRAKPLFIVILVSWGVALLEYCLQVPANRLGQAWFSLPQLKVAQEIITMLVFALFCVIYMKQKLTLDYLWAGIALVAAAFFMFRNVPAVYARQPVPTQAVPSAQALVRGEAGLETGCAVHPALEQQQQRRD